MVYPGEMVEVTGDIWGQGEIKKGMFWTYSLLYMPPLIPLHIGGIPI